MSEPTDPPDHGVFALETPQQSVVLVQLAEDAQRNRDTPGHAWGRFQGKRTVGGRTEMGVKVLHVDLTRKRLTITEEWDGKETARQTIDLDIDVDVPSGPTPPPEPGPAKTMFHRFPFNAAALNPEPEVREWVLARADQDVLELSALPRRIRLFGEGFQEVVALPQALAPNVAPGTGATLRALFTRPGVERRFVEGWFGSVDGRGTAWILEVGERNRWWLAMRAFERRPGLIGQWTGAWSQRAGSGVTDLSNSLRSVLEPPPGERPIAVGKPRPPGTPELRMSSATLPPAEEVPATAEAVASRIGREWELSLPLGKTPDEPRVTVFRGQEFESWVLEDALPAGPDDVIRAIAARGERPTAIAFVRMGVFNFQGEAFRALITDGEAQGRRWTRALLMGLAPDGTVLGFRIVARDHGEVGENGWIGVPPPLELSLFTFEPKEG